MLSQSHSGAARRNGALSHGPVSPQGKARSSQNHTTHGLTSHRLFVHPDQDEEFAAFNRRFLDELKPKGPTEEVLFHEIIHAGWKLIEIDRHERALATQANGDPSLTPILDLQKQADRLLRYRTAHDRAFHRNLNQLRQLQHNRLFAEQLPKLLPPDCPPLADKAAFTRRTQQMIHANIQSFLQGQQEEAKLFETEAKTLADQAKTKKPLRR